MYVYIYIYTHTRTHIHTHTHTHTLHTNIHTQEFRPLFKKSNILSVLPTDTCVELVPFKQIH